MGKLFYLGQQVADDLADKVYDNLERYKVGDFFDLEAKGDWRIPLSIEADINALSRLEQGNEIENSLIVGHALSEMTPTLARENRIWLRLSHIECLEYSRQRWLNLDSDDDKIISEIKTHFFAPTLAGCRDDHSISRLWWNYHIAKKTLPEAPERALNLMLARADIRLNFLERPGLAARPALSRGIIGALERSEALLKGEALFREFMKTLNLMGAGIAFEVWNEKSIDDFMDKCLEKAEFSLG